MSTIYIVYGMTGEYSYRTDWNVEAHHTEAGAQARVNRLEELLRENGGTADTFVWKDRQRAEKAMREHADGDQHCRIDYTGTRYGYTACELVSP